MRNKKMNIVLSSFFGKYLANDSIECDIFKKLISKINNNKRNTNE